jgi:hypothetical protein
VWRRWKYVMIDEYQDTNGVQLDMARHLAGARRNLCVVGDDDQSIYAFRGADVRNILEFERHFPGAKVIHLVQNYRSTKRILAAANAVIAGNPHRHAKKVLRTDNPIGEPIDLYEHEDDALEAETVAREIALRRYRYGTKWKRLRRPLPHQRPVPGAGGGHAGEERAVPGGGQHRVLRPEGGGRRRRLPPRRRPPVRRDRRPPHHQLPHPGHRPDHRHEGGRARPLPPRRVLRHPAPVTDDDVGAAQARAIRAFEAILDRAGRR